MNLPVILDQMFVALVHVIIYSGIGVMSVLHVVTRCHQIIKILMLWHAEMHADSISEYVTTTFGSCGSGDTYKFL